jgi:PHD/YefM family antitoxin component YafN of YafNO toxin-antitoxin module
MNISKDIKPITYLKTRATDLLEQINETHRPVLITQNGEPKAWPRALIERINRR